LRYNQKRIPHRGKKIEILKAKVAPPHATVFTLFSLLFLFENKDLTQYLEDEERIEKYQQKIKQCKNNFSAKVMLLTLKIYFLSFCLSRTLKSFSKRLCCIMFRRNARIVN